MWICMKSLACLLPFNLKQVVSCISSFSAIPYFNSTKNFLGSTVKQTVKWRWKNLGLLKFWTPGLLDNVFYSWLNVVRCKFCPVVLPVIKASYAIHVGQPFTHFRRCCWGIHCILSLSFIPIMYWTYIQFNVNWNTVRMVFQWGGGNRIF
jgi:hypothetical protein